MWLCLGVTMLALVAGWILGRDWGVRETEHRLLPEVGILRSQVKAEREARRELEAQVGWRGQLRIER